MFHLECWEAARLVSGVTTPKPSGGLHYIFEVCHTFTYIH